MTTIQKMTYSAMFITLGVLLPFLTVSNPLLGQMFLLMHIPSFLAGFLLGPKEGALVGFVTPLLRALIVTIPPLYPTALLMAFELASYGLVAGFMVMGLKNHPWKVPLSLIVAMLLGRIVWGTLSAFILGFTQTPFGYQAFLAGAFINAWPGIILQLILIPLVVHSVSHRWKTFNPS